MNDSLKNLKSTLTEWATDAHSQGLLISDDVEAINHFNEQTPASLFDIEERPLVVGLFGGTGVGKSTLLNRLAGEKIARTSVERPTSREVTMYLHNTVQVNHLPPEFPIDKISSAFHNNDKNRHILWIDMPDFDSVEVANRQLVTNWLPHIDVLIYVVSPERYKDDNGWRLLLQHGHRHAWVFVINHWDRGNDAQRSDFTHLLIEAGLSNPMLFCTDSSSASELNQDEFAALESTIQSMADANTVQQLEARGITVRVNEMRSLVDDAIVSMGTSDSFAQLAQDWTTQWTREAQGITESLQWKFPLLAEPFATNEPGFFKSMVNTVLGRSNPQSTPPALPLTTLEVIDDDCLARIKDSLDELAHRSAVHRLPVTHIRNQLNSLKPALATQLDGQISQSLGQSLAKPGTALQRFAHRSLSILSSILPLLAMVWVLYRVVGAFYEGGSTPAAYLSSNFAINGLLLIGLAWLVPFFLARKTKPSRVKAAIRGLNEGTRFALAQVGADVQEQLATAATNSNQAAEQGRALFQQIENPTPDRPAKNLERVLIDA